MNTLQSFELDFLFKKSLGVVASKLSTTGYGDEAAGSAKPKIIPSLQIYSQSIPTYAPGSSGATVTGTAALLATLPADLTVTTSLIPTKYITGLSNYYKKQTSGTYSWISLYTLELTPVIDGFSYRFNNPASANGNLNLLENAIPSNYEPVFSSYKPTVYYFSDGNHTNTGTPINIPATSASYPWVLDSDSGYLYFIKYDSNTRGFPSGVGNPYITFYRYEGEFGSGGSGNSLATQFTI